MTSCQRDYPLKTPGPDGMHAIFYRKCWNTIGKSISNMISSDGARGRGGGAKAPPYLGLASSAPLAHHRRGGDGDSRVN